MRRLRFPAAALAAALAGCGNFTNVPAQVFLKSVDVHAKIEYRYDSGIGRVVGLATNPKVTLESQQGSIGITFDEAIVSYFADPAAKNTISGTSPSGQAVPTSIRVSSSHLNKDANGNVTAGGSSGSVELAVLTPVISAYGRNAFFSGNPWMLITLNGEDDAGWSRTLEIRLPISLTGSPCAPTGTNPAGC